MNPTLRVPRPALPYGVFVPHQRSCRTALRCAGRRRGSISQCPTLRCRAPRHPGSPTTHRRNHCPSAGQDAVGAQPPRILPATPSVRCGFPAERQLISHHQASRPECWLRPAPVLIRVTLFEMLPDAGRLGGHRWCQALRPGVGQQGRQPIGPRPLLELQFSALYSWSPFPTRAGTLERRKGRRNGDRQFRGASLASTIWISCTE